MLRIKAATVISAIVLSAGLALTPTAAGPAGAAVASATKSSPPFDLPYSWKSYTAAGVPDDASGYDPINVVIVAAGIPEAAVLAGLDDGGSKTSWHAVGIGKNPLRDQCISAQDAAIEPKSDKRADQSFSWRTVKCTSPQLILSRDITNHIRGYVQKGTGAWFLSASLEHFCLIGAHGITPWHCITKNGYDEGRDQLIADLRADMPIANYDMTITYSKPGKYYKAGSVPQHPLDYHVGYDGRVAIVTIKNLACAPIC
jgi:hypothetical protein